MAEIDEYSLRTYREEDERDVILLFNKAYEDFAGFVRRTDEYWRWCILSRPNLSAEGIAIVTHADKVVGYAAVEKSGNILEFCHDPDYDGKEIVSMLLQWCLDYASFQGSNSVSLNAPIQDNVVRRACMELEFTEEPFPTLFLKVQNLPQLLKEILSQGKIFEDNIEETVFFSLRNSPSWCPSHVSLRIQKGTATIEMGKTANPTITIETDLSTISTCIFGSTQRLYRAIMERQLKIRPFRKIMKVAGIFSVLRLRKPWFIPGADYG